MNPVEFLTKPDTYSVGLHILLLRTLGIEYLEWESETVWQECKRIFGQRPSLLNRGKIQACRTLHIAETPYSDWFIFEKTVLGLVGLPVQFHMMQKPSVNLVAVGVQTMQSLRLLPFSSDVEKYIAGILLDEGFVFPPAELLFVKGRLGPHVPQQQFQALSRLGTVSQISLPSDPDLSFQVMKLRSVRDYVAAFKQVGDEHTKLAEALAAEVSESAATAL